MRETEKKDPHKPQSPGAFTLPQRARAELWGGKRKVPVPQKCASIQSEPVLFFDNEPNDSSPTIELLTITEVAELLKHAKFVVIQF